MILSIVLRKRLFSDKNWRCAGKAEHDNSLRVLCDEALKVSGVVCVELSLGEQRETECFSHWLEDTKMLRAIERALS